MTNDEDPAIWYPDDNDPYGFKTETYAQEFGWRPPWEKEKLYAEKKNSVRIFDKCENCHHKMEARIRREADAAQSDLYAAKCKQVKDLRKEVGKWMKKCSDLEAQNGYLEDIMDLMDHAEVD